RFQHNAVSGSHPANLSDAGGRNGRSTKRSVLGANNVAVLGKRGFHIYVHHETPAIPRQTRMDLGTNKPSGNFTWTPGLRADKAGRITDHEFGGDAVLGSIVSTSMVCNVKSIKSAYSNLRTWNANCRQRRLQEIAYLYIVETQNGNVS